MKSNCKSSALTFALLTLLLSWSFEAILILSGSLKTLGPLPLVGLMWIPGMVSIALRLRSGSGFKDLLVRGPLKFYLWAALLPLALALATNFLGLPLGMTIFSPIALERFLAKLGPIAFAFVFDIAAALGEELGWRGFLLPKMIEEKMPYPYLFTGIVWALWHAPIVSLGGYYEIQEPLWIAIIYSFSVLTCGYVIGRFRMASGSLAVATLFHASHNFFFQLAVPRLLFPGAAPQSQWWELVGADCGVIVGLLYGIVAIYLAFTPFPAKA